MGKIMVIYSRIGYSLLKSSISRTACCRMMMGVCQSSKVVALWLMQMAWLTWRVAIEELCAELPLLGVWGSEEGDCGGQLLTSLILL